MNGLDIKEWDPARDRFLPPSARFDGLGSMCEAKAHARALLQQQYSLLADPEVHLASLLTCSPADSDFHVGLRRYISIEVCVPSPPH